MAHADTSQSAGTSPTPTLVRQHSSELRSRSAHDRDAEKGRYPEPQWVDFDGPDDPANPHNWSNARKGLYTLLLGFLTAGATFGSAVFSAALQPLSEIYGVSTEVMVLGQSLFVLGFAFGPVCFGPLSEIYGRKLSVLVPYFVYLCFTAATATSENMQSIFITRFFAGLFASAPVSNSGGALADLWSQKERGTAVVIYAMAIVGGPTLAPLVGNAITTSYLGWRWTQYIQLIIAALAFTLNLVFVPETNAQVILTAKARRLRYKTGNWLLLSHHEAIERNLSTFLHKTVTTPVRLLVQEPVLLVVCLYNAFVYGLLYSFFQAFPIVFEEHRGWTAVEGSLPFLAILVGIFIAGGIQVYWSIYHFAPAVERGNGHAPPEMRLPPMMLGSIVFPIGLFWFGNTANSHWANEIVACLFVGCGFLLIFQSGINFIIDCFAGLSASAIAANTLLRSLLASGLPFAVMPMYHNLGIRWATNLIGFVAVALAVSPFLFYVYGPALRRMSKTMRS